MEWTHVYIIYNIKTRKLKRYFLCSLNYQKSIVYVLQPGLDQINTLHKLQHCYYYYCNAGVRIGIWVANEPILNAEGGRKSTFQLKISFSIEHNSYTPDSISILCRIIYKNNSIVNPKFIIGFSGTRKLAKKRQFSQQAEHGGFSRFPMLRIIQRKIKRKKGRKALFNLSLTHCMPLK